MGDENAVCGNNILQLHGRPVTRALASALRASSKSSIESATTQNQARVLRPNSKRTALDDKKSNAPKKRAILKDITNISCQNSYTSCFNVAVVNYTMLLLYMTTSMFFTDNCWFFFPFRWIISSRERRDEQLLPGWHLLLLLHKLQIQR